MNRTTTNIRDQYTDQPIYWFALLDRAVERGDHEAARAAQQELERLGVRVRYGRPRPRKATAGSGGAGRRW